MAVGVAHNCICGNYSYVKYLDKKKSYALDISMVAGGLASMRMPDFPCAVCSKPCHPNMNASTKGKITIQAKKCDACKKLFGAVLVADPDGKFSKSTIATKVKKSAHGIRAGLGRGDEKGECVDEKGAEAWQRGAKGW
jgi:hypothetical protein